MALGDIVGRLQTVGEQLVLFALAFLVTYLLGRLVVVPAVARVLDARDVSPTVRQPGVRALHAVVVAVAVGVGLSVGEFTRLLSASSTLAAAIALAVGFAARDVISNLISGVFMIADPEFDIGDIVRWNGKEGVVEDISFRVTRVRTFDNELMSVPNTELATTTVTNVNAKERRRHRVTFGVGYDDDIDEAQRLVRAAAADNERIQERPSPEVNVAAFADSHVELEALVWTGATAPAGSILSSFRKAVKARFDEAGVEMPYPYRQLTGGIELDDGEPATRRDREEAASAND